MAFRPSKKKRHRKDYPEPGITLTSIVDIFICLLLFLLQSYSSSDAVVVSDESFHLPTSASQADPVPALTIKVNNEVIVLDNEKVVNVSQVIQNPDLLIRPLFQGLLERAGQTKRISTKNATV